MPKVEIYTKSWCPYCVTAKKLLKSKGVRFEETDIGHNEKRTREMQERSGRHTVPQVYINGHHVGGSDDLAEADRTGQLDLLLRNESRAA